MLDLAPVLIPTLSFGAIAAVVLVLGRHYAVAAAMQRRLPAPAQRFGPPVMRPPRGIEAFVTRYFDEKRFGIDGAQREKLRRDLLKAGVFAPHAVNYYIFVKVAGVLGLPALVYVFSSLALAAAPVAVRIALVALVALIAIAGPDAFLSRRQRFLAERYRQIFPDLLDLLVVCVDAGLGLDAAFERVRSEIAKQCRPLGQNIEMMGAEMRAGRSMVQALESLSDRLGLDEAKSFATMLRQSIELGSDVSEALRVFSDDMREKRLLRAEEAANKLSVKIVIPLGLFIFPVVLMVIMLPVVVRLMEVLGQN
jgi:tight adherence protein C